MRAMFKPVSPKVDFPAMERRLLKEWYEKGVVAKYLHRNNGAKKRFSFLDGPITANNPMGVHHAWGRTYKDLWQRFWNMRGYKQRFRNGFDEQGLWVEVEVEKELGLKNKKDIENLVPQDKFKSLEKFINLCKERAEKFSAIQTEQSKRLGYFMDWDNSYHTSSDENNYAIWNFLKVVHEKGWFYKGRDSVPWCPRCGTAISQHEILTEEYKELTHRTVVFKLKLKGKENEFFLAWTTTPWTIPGNVALAVDPNRSYWKMTNEQGEKIVLINPTASGDLEKEAMFVNRLHLTEEWRKVEELKGNDLVSLEYESPYDKLPAVQKALGRYTHRVVATDPRVLEVNPSEGTGIIHIAPGAGSEDFQLGKKEKLPVIEEIDEMGVFLEGLGFISGLDVKEASKHILEDLEKRNLAFSVLDYTHRYPTCWRCKSELVWRVVDEWYIAMDRKDRSGKTYREQMIEVAKEINWIPTWGLERELDWLLHMHDWLISKKRYWGLALPVWECQMCGSFDVIGGREEMQRKAVAGWEEFSGHSPHRPWIDQIKITCSKCGQVSSRIPDVGNPWLDAGIVPFSTMPKEWFPADFITESFPGQFKNWFYSLIAMSTALENTVPFKTVLGFATMVDEKGEPFHKSKGNAIEFVEGADKAGADVIRWFCAQSNPEQNTLFGFHVADETRRKFHLMVWNVYNFFVTHANADGWEVKETQSVKHTLQSVLDRWILSRLQGTVQASTLSLEKFDSRDAALAIESFINDFSLWYVRRSRDRVGPSAQDQYDKEDCYQTFYITLTTLVKLLAPFTPFIAEEIYTNLTTEESVHLADWPIPDKDFIDVKCNAIMLQAMELASKVHAFRKGANVKVRIPFRKLSYKGPSVLPEEVMQIVLDEVNVSELPYEGKSEEYEISGDTSEQNQDLMAGEAREIIRMIQGGRKKLGTRLDELVVVELPDFPKNFEEEIKKKALVKSLVKGKGFKIFRA